jgi:hypothetical protein
MENILSTMAIEKNNTMEVEESFKCLLKYYVKMNVGQFIELLEQTQTTQTPLLWGKKNILISNAYTMGASGLITKGV